MTAEKFDFLMSFTNTTNKTFAYEFSFDVSYISRIRKGTRNFPGGVEFLTKTSLFFAERIQKGGLQHTASLIINSDRAWPSDIEAAGRLIFLWCETDTEQSSVDLNRYLISSIGSKNTGMSVPEQRKTEKPSDKPQEKTLTFLGSKGKRDAFLFAFDALCSTRKPYDILVYSDEALGWFTEDDSFFSVWKEYCMELIRNGSSFTLISYLNRNLKDLQKGISMWLPLSMTGAVRIFTCNILDDKIFSRTLCIARDTIAISSNSLSMSNCPSVNNLYTDRETVNSLTAEFDTYLSLCTPLFMTYSFNGNPVLFRQLKEFETAPADLVSVSTSPALFALPESLCDDLIQRTGCTKLKTAAADAVSSFRRLMAEGFSVTCIVRLPSKTDLMGSKVPFPVRSLYAEGDLYYLPEEYLCHLENLLSLASDYPNLRLVLYSGKWLPDHIDLQLKPASGVIMDIALEKDKLFFITEPSILASLKKLIMFTAITGDILSFSKRTIRSYIADVRKQLEAQSFHGSFGE